MYLGQHAVLKSNNMVKQSIYCTQVMKKDFNKELVMSKEDDKNFESSTKC